MDNLKPQIIQVSIKHKSKIQDVNVIGKGDPSQTALTRWERFCFAMLDWGRRSGAGSKKVT